MYNKYIVLYRLSHRIGRNSVSKHHTYPKYGDASKLTRDGTVELTRLARPNTHRRESKQREIFLFPAQLAMCRTELEKCKTVIPYSTGDFETNTLYGKHSATSKWDNLSNYTLERRHPKNIIWRLVANNPVKGCILKPLLSVDY